MANPLIPKQIYTGILPQRQWLPVLSSNLQAVMFVPHDPRVQSPNMLFIRFVNGSIYCYYNVPRQVWLDLMKAPSKGIYHWRRIRNRFSFSKVA